MNEGGGEGKCPSVHLSCLKEVYTYLRYLPTYVTCQDGRNFSLPFFHLAGLYFYVVVV